MKAINFKIISRLKANEKSFNEQEFEEAKFRLQFNLAITKSLNGEADSGKELLDKLSENKLLEKQDCNKFKQIAVAYSMLAIKFFDKDHYNQKLDCATKAIKYFHDVEKKDYRLIQDKEQFLFFSDLLFSSVIETNRNKSDDYFNELMVKIKQIRDVSTKRKLKKIDFKN